MASRKRKRLSVWGVLARLGHTGDDHDEIVQHVFESASRQTLRSQDGESISGDDFLVSVFESLGTTKNWPGCGTPEWERLRTVALRRVVARLAREGLLDCVSVGVEGTPAPSATETRKPTDVKDGERDEGAASDGTGDGDKDVDCETETEPPAAKDEGLESDGVDARDGEDKADVAAGRRPTKTSNTMLQVSEPAAKDEGSVADAVDGDEAPTATDGGQVGEAEIETPSTEDDIIDPRVGVQVFAAYFRRRRRNPDGWFRGVDRDTPYKVLAQWASETCPGVARESLVALLDEMRLVKWWDDDGHIIGGEMLAVLESELEEGCGHEQWMLVVSDFEDAIQRLRGVFEKLSLL